MIVEYILLSAAFFVGGVWVGHMSTKYPSDQTMFDRLVEARAQAKIQAHATANAKEEIEADLSKSVNQRIS